MSESPEEQRPPPPRQTVAIAYPYFPHYRAAVLRELMEHSRHHYVLIADKQDPESFGGEQVVSWKELEKLEGERFIVTRCRRLPGGAMWQRGLIGQAWRGSFDTIIYYGHAGFPSTWLAAAISRLRGKHVLMWTHGWTRPDKGLRRLIRNTFYRLAHGLVLYGHLGKVIGINQGFRPERLHVIYNSLDVEDQLRIGKEISEEQVRAVRERFAEPDRPLVVSTGRLISVKKLSLLIDAAGGLKQQGRPMNLLLVGSGPEKGALTEQANRLGIDVDFYGACYDEHALAAIMLAADVCVVPGKVGLTAMHAMIYGTPVVSNDQPWGQMPEWEAIVPGKTGDLFAADDAQSLQTVLSHWVEPSLDREPIRKACIEMVTHIWNAKTQRHLIDHAVERRPANDLEVLNSH